VAAWVGGDSLKALYFFVKSSPTQFLLCAVLQVLFDIVICLQIFFYRGSTKSRSSEEDDSAAILSELEAFDSAAV